VPNRDDAPDEAAEVSRNEAQAWFTRFLLRRVRRDDYPSTTQLDLIEKSIPREMLPQYLRVLVDKVAHDMFPSVPLLRRIQHLIEHLPDSGHRPRPSRAEGADRGVAHDTDIGRTASEEEPTPADQPER
jgi:hypothetical protein